jgi:hypothetical protein
MALRKSLAAAYKAVTEASSRDIIKHMKSGLSDKTLPVQRAAADVGVSVRWLSSLLTLFSGAYHHVFTRRAYYDGLRS